MTDIETPPGENLSSASQDEKNLCMFTHLLGIISFWLGPLIIWLIKKDQSRVVGQHALEVLNFEITLTIASVALSICSIILIHIPVLGPLLIDVCWLAIMVFNIVNCVLGALAARDGMLRRYPFSLNLVK